MPKLTSLLESLDVYETNRCRKFLQSPFFNEDERLVRLFDLLISAKKHHHTILFSKQEIWLELKEKMPFKDTKFRRWCSDLTQLVLQFLAQEAHQNKEMPEQQYFIEVIQERNLEKFFHVGFRNAENTLFKRKQKDSDFYFYQYKLNEAQQKQEFETKGHAGQESFDVLMQNLDAFYLAQKLRYCCHWLNYRKVLRLEGRVEVPLMRELMEYIEANKEVQVPIVAIYHQVALTLLEDEKEQYYQDLKQLLEIHSHLFSAEEAWEMYGYALNYCIRKINTGAKYLAELFDLYQVTLNKAVILNDGELDHQHFKNMIAIALRLKQFDWVMNFIEVYQSKLPEKVRENAYTYNMARVYFSKREWDKVIELLQQVEYDEVFYKLDSKALLLKTYYESGEWLVLESLIDSFQTLLRRNKEISKQHRSNYLNLVRFVKKINGLMPNDTVKIKVLKQKIEATSQVADRGWLLEKLEEIV
ncbi:MAG: hypothetical protein ACPGVB_03725 [Chitinophagales bacterium]